MDYPVVSSSQEILWMSAVPLSVASLALGVIANNAVDTKEIYARMQKPFFAPPAYMFGIVWTILHITMPIAYWLARTANILKDDYESATIFLYGILMVSLPVWSLLFFVKKQLSLSFVWIIATVIIAITTTLVFGLQGGSVPFLLMAPLCVWTAFAASLNGSIMMNNVTIAERENGVVRHVIVPLHQSGRKRK